MPNSVAINGARRREDALSRLLTDSGLATAFAGSLATSAERGFHFPGTFDAALHIVLRGCAWVGSRDSDRRLDPGGAALLPSDEPSHVYGRPGAVAHPLPSGAPPATLRAHVGAEGRQAFQVLTLAFQYRNAQARPLLGALPATMYLKLSDDIVQLASHTAKLLEAESPGTEFATLRLAEALFCRTVAQGVQSLDAPEGWMPALRDDQLGVVLNALHREPARHLSVNQLAKLAGVSPATLYRRFSALTGMSPARYARNIRLRRASALLRSHSMSVAEVAEATGYASESSFSRAFVELNGRRPGSVKTSRAAHA